MSSVHCARLKCFHLTLSSLHSRGALKTVSGDLLFSRGSGASVVAPAMAMSNAELGANIDHHRMQIADLATQVDILNRLTENISVPQLKSDIINTFSRCQARITALESKLVLIDQELDKANDKLKDARSKDDGKQSLVDGKWFLMSLRILINRISDNGPAR